MRDLEGRVAVVTGGASGIGLSLARRFAARGMKIVVADIEGDALDTAVSHLRDGGADAHGVVTDVSDAAQVQALADATLARFGALHVVCNNAGVGAGGMSWELPLSTWEWVLGVNLWGVVHGVRTFVPILMEQDAGHVVNTASVAGLVAAPFMGPYNASKHAVVAVSETLHHELGMSAPHVKVSVLCPAWVKTRIAESDRNRPDHLREPGGDPGPGAEVLQAFIDTGMDPDEVAGRVVDAVTEDRFWILTHDDPNDHWMSLVQGRLDSVSGRSNPIFGVAPAS